MSMGTESNERLVRVEAELDSLVKTNAKIEAKVDQMYEAFVQAKGARWAVITLWVGIGAAAANLKWLLSALGIKIGA